MVDYQVDEIVPSLTVRYKSRKDAEMALSQGKVNFSDAALHVVWHLPAKTGLLTHQASLKEGDHDLLTSLGVSDELGHGDAALSADENEEEDEDNQVSPFFCFSFTFGRGFLNECFSFILGYGRFA